MKEDLVDAVQILQEEVQDWLQTNLDVTIDDLFVGAAASLLAFECLVCFASLIVLSHRSRRPTALSRSNHCCAWPSAYLSQTWRTVSCSADSLRNAALR